MGKNHNIPRTKGNMRPSSSANSASLLLTSVNKSLATLSVNLVPLQQLLDDISTVDPDISLCFKRMIKRDAITKTKALQEFAELCKEKDEQALQLVLPVWTRLYNKLYTELDHKVREATHMAHESLVLKVGRGIAPHLKAIMAAWLISQCDCHLPAASLAQASFQAAFSPDKQSEALAFCKKEIISFLETNLLDSNLISSVDDISNPEAPKSLHLVLGSLNGLSLFLSKVPEIPPNLLSDSKFWKLGKSKNSQIRAAWYKLLARICQSLPQVANEHASRLVPSTLNHLSESDPVVVPALWEAILYTLTTVENCWQHVNCEKSVLPQLWSLLKEGGHGNAPQIFPNLLPLLANLPPVLLGPPFLHTFFSHFVTGLSKVVTEPAERAQAVLSAYLECLRWSIKLDPTLVKEKFQPWLYSVLSDPEGKLCQSKSLQKVQGFLCAVNQEQLWEVVRQYCLDYHQSTSQGDSTVLAVRRHIAGLLCSTPSDNPHLRDITLAVCRHHLPLLQQDAQNLATLASLVKMAPSAEFFTSLCSTPTDLYWVYLKPTCMSVDAVETALELLVALPELTAALNILLDISTSPLALGILLDGLAHRRETLLHLWLEDKPAVQAALALLCQPHNLQYLEQVLPAVGPPLADPLLSLLSSPPPDDDRLVHHCRLVSAVAPHCQDSQLKGPLMELFNLACRTLQQENHHEAVEGCLKKCWELISDKKSLQQEISSAAHDLLMNDLTQQGLKPLLRICLFVLNSMAAPAQLASDLVVQMFPSVEEWECLYLRLHPQKLCSEWEPQGSTDKPDMAPLATELATDPLLVAAFCSGILLSPSAVANPHPTLLTAALPCIFCIHYNTYQEGGDQSDLMVELTENINQLRTLHQQTILSSLFNWSKQKGYLSSLTLKEQISKVPTNPWLEQLKLEDLEGSQHTLQVLAELGIFSTSLRPTLVRFLVMVPPVGRLELGLLSSFLSSLPLDKIKEDVGFFTCHLQDLLKAHPQAFITQANIEQASEEQLLWNCWLAKTTEACLRCPKTFTKTSWEKVLCILGDWVTAVDHCGAAAVDTALAVRVFSLVGAVHRAMAEGLVEKGILGNLDLGRMIVDKEVKVEWDEFFAPMIHKVLLKWLFSVEQGSHHPSVLVALATAVVGVPASRLSQDHMGQLVGLVQFPRRSIKIASHHLILSMIPKVPQEEQPAEAALPEEEDDLVKRLLPVGLVDVLVQLGARVQELVADWQLGQCAVLSDQDTLATTTYLLSWHIALRMLAASHPLMRYQVANSLSDSGLLANFLENLFHLMPTQKLNKTLFQKAPPLAPEGRWCSTEEVHHLSCYLYCETLCNLPAAARRWFNNLEKRERDLVDKYTTTWVSGILIGKEIGVNNYNGDNLVVKFRPTIRAVTAAYTIEDVTTELEVTLPLNHPLGPLSIEANQRIKVRAQQWKVWLRQLNTFLIQQNGSVLEGLVLWKKNIDRVFQGMEECTVCYYVLHGSTGLLPKLKCRVCHKNFHSTCLFKWFRTSNSAKCPHCRGIFW